MLVFFFFQAEDGIRDLVRSRGLGDVYKRQVQYQLQHLSVNGVLGLVKTFHHGPVDADRWEVAVDRPRSLVKAIGDGIKPVSYTHLTLPTSDLV